MCACTRVCTHMGTHASYCSLRCSPTVTKPCKSSASRYFQGYSHLPTGSSLCHRWKTEQTLVLPVHHPSSKSQLTLTRVQSGSSCRCPAGICTLATAFHTPSAPVKLQLESLRRQMLNKSPAPWAEGCLLSLLPAPRSGIGAAEQIQHLSRGPTGKFGIFICRIEVCSLCVVWPGRKLGLCSLG